MKVTKVPGTPLPPPPPPPATYKIELTENEALQIYAMLAKQSDTTMKECVQYLNDRNRGVFAVHPKLPVAHYEQNFTYRLYSELESLLKIK